MANNGLLYISNEPKHLFELKKQTSVCMSNYIIPLFWMMMLDKDSLATYADEEGEEFVYCSMTVDDALKRCESREERLSMIVSDYHAHLKQWKEFLKRAAKKGKYISFELTEILWMSDEDGVAELKSALQVWDEATDQSFVDFFSLTSLPEVYDEETHEIIPQDDGSEEDFLFGYMPTPCYWVPWAPKKPLKKTLEELQWHPIIPASCFCFTLYNFIDLKMFRPLPTLGVIIVFLWFALSVYDRVSGGKISQS